MNGKNEIAEATVATASQNGNGDFITRQQVRLEEEKSILIKERENLTNPKKVNYNFEGDPAWENKIRRVGEKLSAVEIALMRVKNGSYLTCTSCGKEIEKQRLEACPAPRICCGCMPVEPPKKMRRF